jgi:cell division septation protein DedD
MNEDDLKDGSSLRAIGKEFIIVIAVVFLSLGFTLGFFVGERSGGKKAQALSQISEQVSTPQDPVPQPLQSTVEPLKTDEASSQPSAQSADNALPAQQTASFPVETESPKQQAGNEEVKKGPAADDMPLRPRPKKVEKEVLYTVQIGALSSRREAENFKVRYEQKGYKIFIIASKSAKNGKIYRIRTGKFKERKDAETLSLELKKTEGLNTFVTVNNE